MPISILSISDTEKILQIWYWYLKVNFTDTDINTDNYHVIYAPSELAMNDCSIM